MLSFLFIYLFILLQRVRQLTDEATRLSSDLSALRLRSPVVDRAPRPSSDLYNFLLELDPNSLVVDDRQRLGEGSFGIVYRAVYNATPVAVKKLRIGLIEQKRVCAGVYFLLCFFGL